ncbi:MAG: AAA family ATPase [bacterium]
MSHLKLTRIEIEGFRRFRANWRLDLRSPAGTPLDYLVLAGPNGCGKTSVLEAIVLALGRDDLIARGIESKKHRAAPWFPLEPATRLLAVVDDIDLKRQYIVERTAEGLRPRARIGVGRPFTHEWSVFKEKLAPLSVEYISSRRLPAHVGPVQDAIKGQPLDAIEANRIARFKHRVRQQQGRRVPGYKGPEPLDRVWMDRLNAFWRTFRDDGTHLVMTLVDPEDLDANEWDLFLYQGDDRICSIDALSSGEQEIIALVVPFITEPFDGLLLIDEPELHLHPQWQGRVLRALRGLVPDAQMIVATHADDPWDDALSWERVLLVDPSDPRAHGERDAES